MPFSCTRSHSLCVMTPDDDDVSGHAFTPTNTATFTLTWSTDEHGEARFHFASEDPEAEQALLAFLNRRVQAPVEPGAPQGQ